VDAQPAFFLSQNSRRSSNRAPLCLAAGHGARLFGAMRENQFVNVVHEQDFCAKSLPVVGRKSLFLI
jgi:hypothetical protein